MKLRLVMVSSLDGKTTKWDDEDISTWTSSEDKQIFSQVLTESKVIIMGKKTYVAAKSKMKFDGSKLRVVFTKSPETYSTEQMENQLEFTSSPPPEIIKKLESRGFQDGILVGGSETNSIFAKEGLIDEVWVTLEPMVFGQGRTLFGEDKLDLDLRLSSVEKLNHNGTLLLKYKVL